MLKTNQLKQKMMEGKPVIGTWNTLDAPLVTEVFAHAGFDFQIIDLEHGPFILENIHQHVSACEISENCTPIVRIPDNSEWMALQVLDQGAHGLVVPHIDDADSAKKLVEHTKYHPSGKRGFTPFSKAGGFNNHNTSNYVELANRETMNIVIIESLSGIQNLPEILEVNDIDVLYFGAYDLSQALGQPGNTHHPDVVSAIQNGVELVNRAGKVAGGFVPQSNDDIKWLLDMGMRFITYEVDSSILFNHVSRLKNWFDLEISQ
jgi:4-hydroxy-2-oxoheptanedioate aldolase